MEHTFTTFRAWLNEDYPRPQLCRAQWAFLNGQWRFREDPKNCGLTERWFANGDVFSSDDGLSRWIQVPFPPGSVKSGLLDYHDSDVVWYARRMSASDLVKPADAEEVSPSRKDGGDGQRYLLHFEGVDFHAMVWLNGHLVADHEGGFTSFSIDITPYLQAEENLLVVRARDGKADVSQPRGKQDWRDQPHSIWYHRSTGIWRDVWIEAVSPTYIEDVRWLTDIAARHVECQVRFNDEVGADATLTLTVTVEREGSEHVAHQVMAVSGRNARVIVDIPQLANPHEAEEYLWSPESPQLFDARLELQVGEQTASPSMTDTVVSYFGCAQPGRTARSLTLNDHPVYVRGVLDQGYWAESYLTPPSPQALRRDLEIAKSLGFNTLRAHQRTPEARYLAWADVLGLMIWVEFSAAYEYSPRAFMRTMNEWTQTVSRCAHHPSVVAWVPVNESWGLPQVAHSAQQQAALRALVAATRALDPTRLVIGNDGWHQLDTDLVTLHDYTSNPTALAVAYRDEESLRASLEGDGPQGRPILLKGSWQEDTPVIVTEFGGVSLSEDEDSWGYSQAHDSEAFLTALRGLFDALYSSPILGGWCYTQLTDTGQETNGLCYADRTLKAPLSQLRQIIGGGGAFFAQQVRPRRFTNVF